MKIKSIFVKIQVGILLTCIISCNKSFTIKEADVAYKLIADKTWYLEYAQTTNGTTISSKSYVGQSTYFINYLKNFTTIDSDGINGVYALQNIENKLMIQVDAKTQNGNSSSYQYEVISIGGKNMILSYRIGTSNTLYYFNSQR